MSAIEQPYQQPKSRKFIVGLGAIICALMLYWGEPFSNLTLRRWVPVGFFILGLIFIAPKVGAFVSWCLQRQK